MDNQTNSYYEDNADHLAAKYDLAKTAKFKSFAQNLPLGGSLLDIGCGSGRDAAWFQTQGYTVTAMDASLNFIKYVGKYHPELKPRLLHASLPFLDHKLPTEKFNVISIIINCNLWRQILILRIKTWKRMMIGQINRMGPNISCCYSIVTPKCSSIGSITFMPNN